MLKKSLLLSALLLALTPAMAQSPATTAGTPPAAPAAPSSPAKKDLVNRVLKIQQPGIEAMARNMAEQPAAEIMDRAAAALPARVPADKREAVAKEIQQDAKKYIDEAVPVVRDRAVKLAPSTIGAVLDEKFSEDELRQLVTVLESATWAKYQQLSGEMQRKLQEKLVLETRGDIEPKIKALEVSVGRRLGITEPSAQGGAKAPEKTAAPKAAPAAKPASR